MMSATWILRAVLRHRQPPVSVQRAEARRDGQPLALLARTSRSSSSPGSPSPDPRRDDERDELPGLDRRLPADAGRDVRIVLGADGADDRERIAVGKLRVLLAQIRRSRRAAAPGTLASSLTWLDVTFGEWSSDWVGKMLPSGAFPTISGIVLRRSAGGRLMNASQYGSSSAPDRRQGSRSAPRKRDRSSRRRGSPPDRSGHRLAPLDERFGVLLDRRVVADVALDRCCLRLRRGRRCSSAIGAGVLADLEPGVVAHEADALLRELAPDLVVDPLQRADDRRAGRDRRACSAACRRPAATRRPAW